MPNEIPYDETPLGAAEHWERLAREQSAIVAAGPPLHSNPAESRARLYFRTAQALRLEHETGQPHCACCLKPRKQESK